MAEETNEPKAPKAPEQMIQIPASEFSAMQAAIRELQAQNGNKVAQSRYTEHTKEHTAIMREYISEDEKKKGIVMRMFNVKRVRDKETNQMTLLSDVEVFNPETDKTVIVNVNYQTFLLEAPKVIAKILKINKKQNVTSYWGSQFKTQSHTTKDGREVYNEVPVGEALYEVQSFEYEYELELAGGLFNGAIIKNDGKGLNI